MSSAGKRAAAVAESDLLRCTCQTQTQTNMYRWYTGGAPSSRQGSSAALVSGNCGPVPAHATPSAHSRLTTVYAPSSRCVGQARVHTEPLEQC